jgi:hypothetical protein
MIYVGFDHLEPNKLYYIEQHVLDKVIKKIGTFTRHEITLYYEVACFKNITEFNTPRKNIYDYNFHRGCNFYEVYKFKIQETIENRALKQILENVIQDENFIALLFHE